jgi:(p)ppGpp synthase/HD superfamily hydrolase
MKPVLSENEFMIFLQALRFASDKHRDQRRKDASRSPYINHPIAVADILYRTGGVRDINTLAAALLHDTIEDTDTTPEEIRTRFGQEVLDLVLEVTDDKSLPKARRKELQVENAPHKSTRARQIKIADKISNLTDIIYTPPADWSAQRIREYVDWSERVVNGLRGPNPELEAEYDRVLAEGRAKLNQPD